MTSSWALSWAGGTDTGNVRLQNQDSFYCDPEGRFLILADGMGGHSGGEVASQLTTEAVQHTLETIDWKDPPSAKAVADACVRAATESLKRWVADHPEQQDLGTTLLIWMRSGEQVVLVSLGDSRIYLMREEAIFQLTFDQVIETELRRRGASRSQAARSPGAAYLSRCILANRECEPDVMTAELRDGDVWLLCSDGLTREIEAADMSQILAEVDTCGAQNCVDQLIQKALSHGGRDNVTVIVAKTDLNSVS